MRNNTLAAIITSTLLAAAATQAQPAPVDQTPQTEAKEMATNTPAADGTASSSATADYDQATTAKTGTEAAEAAKAKWTQADTDGSGTLSVSEMQASMPTIASSFPQMDTNADGQVSRDEMHNYKMQHGQREWQKKFSAADTNGDKLLDETEAQSLPMLSEKFASIDTDKDGKVSAEEMRAHHLAMSEDTREASKTLQHSDTAQEADEKRTTSTSSTTTTTTTDDTAGK